MPEIAEVETVRKTLLTKILNKKIKKIDILYKKIVQNDSKEFQNKLTSESFINILRKGKWLIFETNNYYLLSHLRMEGKYFIKDSKDEVEKHEHLIIYFEDNSTLRYHDTRKFGRLKLINKDELDNAKEITKQGYEPNTKELTKEYLYKKIHKKNKNIKTLLLDQSIISGLGNIYANEVLFESSINPYQIGKNLTLNDCQRIVESTNKIIKKAIEMGGTTIKSYTSSLGVTGRFQQELKAHKRENLKCFNCNNLIVKEKINGRSAYFCPKCQRLDN